MYRPNKIINDPGNVVDELIDGVVLAYHGRIRRIEGTGAIVSNEVADGKVGLVIGGGSGHEPLFPGMVGRTWPTQPPAAGSLPRRRQIRSSRRSRPLIAVAVRSWSTATMPVTT